MKPAATEKLQRLLADFEVETLGDGNLNAGTNLLVAMACTIANIQRPGAGIGVPGKHQWLVGTNLLASGPLTSDLIRERVVAPLREMEANLEAHLQEWREDIRQTTQASPNLKPDLRQHDIPPDLSLLRFNGDDQPFREDLGSGLFLPFSNRMRRALLECPGFLATGATPARLAMRIECAHLGKPLVHDVLRDPAHCRTLGECCLPVIDGAAGGNALLCDPSRVLDGQITSEPATWLSRLFWLVEGGTDPELPTPLPATAPSAGMQACFENAVRDGLIARYDHETIEPPYLNADIAAAQSKWVAFLTACEADLPGISAAARTLFPSLVFGLTMLARQARKSSAPQPTVSIEAILALAMHLAMRMGNSRSVLLHSGANERRARWRGCIIDHLSAGPQGARDLSRRFHRMTTTECRDLLGELKRSGQVLEAQDGLWQLTASLHPPRASTLTLDIA